MEESTTDLSLLFLHALPLDGSMWAAQRQVLPHATYAPTLYPLGDTVTAWASGALDMVKGDRLVVVGCSVGGSCALEVAALAPQRIQAQLAPRGRFHVVPDCGHYVPLERPEALNALLGELIETVR